MSAVKRKKGTKATAFAGDEGALPILYIHGIGSHPPKDALKREWDFALFGREMAQTQMAYWADILHAEQSTPFKLTRANTGKTIDLDDILAQADVSKHEKASEFASNLMFELGITPYPMRAKVLPLPAFLRKPISRAFLNAFIKDSAAYFFRKDVRKQIQERLISLLSPIKEEVTIIAHSQGTVITLEVLADLVKKKAIKVHQLVTIGSPLGIREIQDNLSCDLEVPKGIEAWHNFADPLDPVALDKGIGNDFSPSGFIVDDIIVNTNSRRLIGFNPHSAAGYLAHPKVRAVVHRAVRFDTRTRFLVARDVAADFAIEARHPVLIEALEPGYPALGEAKHEMHAHEQENEKGNATLTDRINAIAKEIESIVGKTQKGNARIYPLRRFVSAHLTPSELNMVAHNHRNLRIYAVWKSSIKRKLIFRSGGVIQVDAARASYRASGEGIRWAVLDTGVHHAHPHFKTHNTIEAIWDCTKEKEPIRIDNEDTDKDGHGTHVSGIIAGSSADGTLQGMAPKAKLIVYKVLNDRGEGEDAWIIKALDHIAELNENNSEIFIHGLNLSLGGPYDSTVYGCGFTPLCMELRRLWRSGVLICIASGNEGRVEVTTPDGELELNSPMSIGDPANLEDCIAVGSVNTDHPHLYGISSFSSRGPTSDGRTKPDVVAPGERISSCNSRFEKKPTDLYREESGTSMAAPHISGLLAAFLSVRREFRGRPDEVKELLLRTCIDIHRDRHHQGNGIPNLMKMLLEA